MTESRARRDLDFDYALDDPDDNNGWYGQAQVGDATVMHDVGELDRDDPPETWQDDPDTDSWYVPAQETEVASVPAADDSARRTMHTTRTMCTTRCGTNPATPGSTACTRHATDTTAPRKSASGRSPCPGQSPGTTTSGSGPASSRRQRWRSPCHSWSSRCAVLRPAPRSPHPCRRKRRPAPNRPRPALHRPFPPNGRCHRHHRPLLRRHHLRLLLLYRTLPGSTTRNHVSRRPTNPTSPRSG